MKEALKMVDEMVNSIKVSELNLLKARMAKHGVFRFQDGSEPVVPVKLRYGKDAGIAEYKIRGVYMSEGEVKFLGVNTVLEIKPSDIFAGYLSKITALIYE
ncbi:MAG: hypothetical protein IKW46_02015 [Bacteroidaceae bacterium]|nr:hypothetical protein [Bacteroidaceae bacterium]